MADPTQLAQQIEQAAALLCNNCWTVTPPANAPKFGCFCDLFTCKAGTEPDGCVIDDGRPQDCVYAAGISSKWFCKEWKAWTPETLATYWREMQSDAG